jgi:type IV pilus biogenesis protein CpaD/CtpE
MTIRPNPAVPARIGCCSRLVPALIPALLIMAPALLGGCTTMAPLQMTYHWRPLGTNQANLEAQVERPQDLVHGRPLGDADAHEAALAVQRWRDGKVMNLGDSGLAELEMQSGGTNGGSSGSGSATGGP